MKFAISSNLQSKTRLYLPLIKSLQTGLLLITGVAGYMSARCPVLSWGALAGLAGSLFLAISGSTILNMWYDRDIDRVMNRTHHRPIASGLVSPQEALRLGLAFSTLGVAWAIWLNPLYGLVVFAGLFFDVVIYTIWLKRRTCWSIVWGGIAGGMPILAGRVFGLHNLGVDARVDDIGLLLTLAVLFWIPTHILTFSMRYFDDYAAARLPTFASTYGFDPTRKLTALSSVLAALSIALAAILIRVEWGYVHLLAFLSAGLMILAFLTVFRPSPKLNFGLFKYASVYMLLAMVLLSI
jgi:protoheme IX farnesyltransferase